MPRGNDAPFFTLFSFPLLSRGEKRLSFSLILSFSWRRRSGAGGIREGRRGRGEVEDKSHAWVKEKRADGENESTAIRGTGQERGGSIIRTLPS